MAKRTADVGLRLWTPRGADDPVRQAGRADDGGPHRPRRCASTTAPSTSRPAHGATRSRDYHVQPSPCRPAVRQPRCSPAGSSVVVDGEVVSQSLVRAIWTDDVATVDARSTRRSPTTPARPSWPAAIAEGLEARDGRRSHHGHGSARPGRATRCRERPRRHAAAAGPRGRHRRRQHRHRAPQGATSTPPTRWPSTPARRRPSARRPTADADVSRWPRILDRRLLRRVRRADCPASGDRADQPVPTDRATRLERRLRRRALPCLLDVPQRP